MILCNGAVLETSMQLKHVKDLYWPTDERNLTLTYRRKDQFAIAQQKKKKELARKSGKRRSTVKYASQMANNGAASLQAAAAFCPSKPPAWIPDHLAYNCS